MTIDPLMTKKEVAARLKVSVWAVGQLISKGLLPVVPVGSRVRIRPADVSAYISNQASNRECVTKSTEFIGKSVAARGEATEQDLRDAVTAGVPESMKKAYKEARIQLVMDAYDCPRDDAKSLIKADRKRRKKNNRKAGQQVADIAGRVSEVTPTGSLPSSARAANKQRLAATAESAIEKMILERHAFMARAAEAEVKPAEETATYAHLYVNPYGRA